MLAGIRQVARRNEKEEQKKKVSDTVSVATSGRLAESNRDIDRERIKARDFVRERMRRRESRMTKV